MVKKVDYGSDSTLKPPSAKVRLWLSADPSPDDKDLCQRYFRDVATEVDGALIHGCLFSGVWIIVLDMMITHNPNWIYCADKSERILPQRGKKLWHYCHHLFNSKVK